MDYLFYGGVRLSSQGRQTRVDLEIACQLDEKLSVCQLVPDDTARLGYQEVPGQRTENGLNWTFSSEATSLSLFTVSGESNEVAIPFEVTYAVYGEEVVHLSENDILSLERSTYIYPDGTRKRVGDEQNERPA